MSGIASGFGISSNVDAMMPYQAGKPIEDLAREYGLDPASIVKLASNENPLGMSDSVRQAISTFLDSVPGQALGRYPDPNAFALKQALAEHYQVPANWLTVGNGSNDLLEIISLAILDQQASCVYAEHAFIVYQLATQARGATHIKVPAASFGHDLQAMFEAIGDDTRLVFIANPNNPTGTFHSGDVIRSFVEKVHAAHGNRVTVVLDEAYNEYLDPQLRFDSAQLVRDFSNIIVVRTFSKAYGLAGMRMGFAIARPEMTDYLNRVRQPFNVNLLAQVAAVAALKDAAFLEKTYELNRDGKRWLSAQFAEMGLEFVPSFGNFILLRVGDAAAVNTALLQRGVIVRPVVGDGLPEHLRVSIGLPEENAKFISALKEVQGK
ncbi:histidinol-phosphate transaminase [Advenella sp. FME57]|uniref:histidinol-phosphate transaminase n=1 Tax=Advenella sp. FME57 TaxID=2742604 RepID=UPI001865EEA4|nr:histidinol-phosphate transaminase [Advenella sp. FME57]